MSRARSPFSRWMHNLARFLKNGLFFGQWSANMNSKRYWDRKLRRQGSFWRDAPYRNILDLLPRNSTFSLLDVGCALGDGCELIQKNFPSARITGIDISDAGITTAKSKASGVSYLVLDILKQAPPQSYDYVTVIETLEHFDDPFGVIRRLLTFTLKSVIVSVPYAGKGKSGPVREVGEHRYQFDETTFAGFNHRVVRVTEPSREVADPLIIYEIFPSA